MQIFYSTQIDGNFIVLSDSEAHHCTTVLRKKVGDRIEVVNGFGKYFEGNIAEIGKEVRVLVDHEAERLPPREHKVHLVVSPTKNLDRMEWMVEKATEVGVDRISFFTCENSERKVMRTDRLEKKALSAMKQSGQALLPEIGELTSFDRFIAKITEKGRFLAHLDSDVESVSLNTVPFIEDTVICIGPEGGFSPGEVEVALSHGFRPVTLGKTRLRTETAGVVACTILNLCSFS